MCVCQGTLNKMCMFMCVCVCVCVCARCQGTVIVNSTSTFVCVCVVRKTVNLMCTLTCVCVQALWFTEQKGSEGQVFGSNDQWKGLGVFPGLLRQ